MDGTDWRMESGVLMVFLVAYVERRILLGFQVHN